MISFTYARDNQIEPFASPFPSMTTPDTLATDYNHSLPSNIVNINGKTDLNLKGIPFGIRMIFVVAKRIQWGSFVMILPDDRAFRFQGCIPGHEGIIKINDYALAGKLRRSGTLGVGEAYFAGLWESPNVTELLEVFARNGDHFEEFFKAGKLFRPFQKLFLYMKRNTKAGSRKNIMAHYDLGNEFYSKWLDKSMTYSSAKFEQKDDDLSKAQLNKYRSLAKKLDLKPHHTVLEIGCGWGGFAEYAAHEIGCKLVGVTISPEQFRYAVERIQRSGLEDKVTIRLQDYRDIEGTFDRIVSIEMLEAVGHQFWPTYFDTLRKRLKPGGKAGVQVITIEDKSFEHYKSKIDYIQRYIFPGGMLPSPKAIKEQVNKAGLNWDENINFGLDYARTLREWHNRFQQAWPEIKPLGFDEKFRLLWKYYLSYCEAGFRAGTIDVTQITISRP